MVERWTPKSRQRYWYISQDGGRFNVASAYYSTQLYLPDYVDRHTDYNVFRTRAQARIVLKFIKEHMAAFSRFFNKKGARDGR